MNHQTKKLKTGFAITLLAMLSLVTFLPAANAAVTQPSATSQSFSSAIEAILASALNSKKKMNAILKATAAAAISEPGSAAKFAAIAAKLKPDSAAVITATAANIVPSQALAILTEVLNTKALADNAVKITEAVIGTVNEANKTKPGYTPLTITQALSGVTSRVVRTYITNSTNAGNTWVGLADAEAIKMPAALAVDLANIADLAKGYSGKKAINNLKIALVACGTDEDCKSAAAATAALKLGTIDPKNLLDADQKSAAAKAFSAAMVKQAKGSVFGIRTNMVKNNRALIAQITLASILSASPNF